MASWVFLLVGGLGAIGAALSLGTLAALVQYRRTGDLPGRAEDATEPAPGTERRLWVRIAMGAVVAVICFVSLAQQGLLGGPLAG